MIRIAKGIRQHCDDHLQGYADGIENITPGDVEAIQDDIVSVDDLPDVVDERETPFLVEGPALVPQSENPGSEPDRSVSMVMGQHSNAQAKDAAKSPLPTVATRGAIHYIDTSPFILPRNGAFRGLLSNVTYDPADQPLHTVTAKNHDGHLVSPFLVEYNGNSDSQSLEDPLPTVTTTDRHALCIPDLYPWGLDLRYRMLQPRELAAAQGFPDGYEFAGNKTERTAQIGNAVPVNLGKALCKQLMLPTNQPTMSQFEQPTKSITDPADD